MFLPLSLSRIVASPSNYPSNSYLWQPPYSNRARKKSVLVDKDSTELIELKREVSKLKSWCKKIAASHKEILKIEDRYRHAEILEELQENSDMIKTESEFEYESEDKNSLTENEFEDESEDDE
ncbi:unnamed protein product [Dovyalis caffra]|uniref:Uncharacterized protein n=1 Tax=Dovyalis caffra TaxID=77055 RepID=A0AAV1R8P6_9ROSI|nr:unnamed protein product [Dovyalis caffra]